MLINFTEKNFEFPQIFRTVVSGSSGVGKTYFVKQLIQAKLFQSERVILFHPDACESLPVDWHLSFDVVYKVGLPDVDYLKTLPEYTTIVIDDQFDKVASSPVIDYLVRVLSSKRKLHIILLTQHFFAKGPLGVSIRDSCNIFVFMNGNNNAITRVGRNLNLKVEISAAEEFNRGKLYPFIFIARDNLARSSQLQVFVELFNELKVVILGQMKYYLVEKSDFDSCLKIKSHNVAEYVTKSSEPIHSPSSPSPSYQSHSQSHTPSRVVVNGEEEEDSGNNINESVISESVISKTKKQSKFKSRQKLEAKIRRLVQRHKIRSRF